MNTSSPLGHLLMRCGHMVRLYVDAQMRAHDVTPVQSHALLFLSKADHPVTQRDLAAELRLKAPTVNGLVERLEERGLICRRTSESDARCRLVELTKAGHTLIGECKDTFHQVETGLSRHFTPAEEAQLRDLLSRLITNLESEVSNK